MKLWIDDIRPAPTHHWHVARTNTAAIKAMAMFDIEEVSFDHDISHQVAVGPLSRPYPCEETFQAAAHYFGCKYRTLHPDNAPKVTLHTSNPVGATEMEAILKSYGLECTIKPYSAVNRLEMEV